MAVYIIIANKSSRNSNKKGGLMNSIGERIKKIREEKRISQQELARKINKSQGTVAHLENNDHKGTFEILISICEVLNVSADWILFGKENDLDIDNLSDEGKKMLQEYKKYLEQNYPAKKEYEKAGNL